MDADEKVNYVLGVRQNKTYLGSEGIVHSITLILRFLPWSEAIEASSLLKELAMERRKLEMKYRDRPGLWAVGDSNLQVFRDDYQKLCGERDARYRRLTNSVEETNCPPDNQIVVPSNSVVKSGDIFPMGYFEKFRDVIWEECRRSD